MHTCHTMCQCIIPSIPPISDGLQSGQPDFARRCPLHKWIPMVSAAAGAPRSHPSRFPRGFTYGANGVYQINGLIYQRSQLLYFTNAFSSAYRRPCPEKFILAAASSTALNISGRTAIGHQIKWSKKLIRGRHLPAKCERSHDPVFTSKNSTGAKLHYARLVLKSW